ncbi:MAG TPA: antitoxin family protein [Gemmataceae bacterium]|nr:antitoxin family protein [Gemmataceae bacterium]
MTITIEAIYKNGVFTPKESLALPEGTEVRVTINTLPEDTDPLDEVIGICDGPPDGAANHDKYLYGNSTPARG